MNDLTVLLLGSLGVYRLARMIATEEGPFGAFEAWRDLIERSFGAESWVTNGFNCPLCISFWLALAVAVMAGQWWLWLPIAGGACFLQSQER